MKKFKDWVVQNTRKKLVIIRGVSGSGKSTLAQKHKGDGVVFSTDDYFMQNGVYEFNPKKLQINHRMNKERTEKAMLEGISPIIIDNTNSEAWEIKPYVELADKYGYEVKIVETDPVDIEELVRRQESRKKINKTIPRNILEKMLSKYKRGLTIDDIRNS
jgi:NEDD4-binding protein 2